MKIKHYLLDSITKRYEGLFCPSFTFFSNLRCKRNSIATGADKQPFRIRILNLIPW